MTRPLLRLEGTVVSLAQFVASNEGAYITGSDLVVDGGMLATQGDGEEDPGGHLFNDHCAS